MDKTLIYGFFGHFFIDRNLEIGSKVGMTTYCGGGFYRNRRESLGECDDIWKLWEVNLHVEIIVLYKLQHKSVDH